jgi:hypothetical protein
MLITLLTFIENTLQSFLDLGFELKLPFPEYSMTSVLAIEFRYLFTIESAFQLSTLLRLPMHHSIQSTDCVIVVATLGTYNRILMTKVLLILLYR